MPHLIPRSRGFQYDAREPDEDLIAEREVERANATCNRCGSTDVRWRQQGGGWVLFSLTPGVEHACDFSNDFDVVTR